MTTVRSLRRDGLQAKLLRMQHLRRRGFFGIGHCPNTV